MQCHCTTTSAATVTRKIKIAAKARNQKSITKSEKYHKISYYALKKAQLSLLASKKQPKPIIHFLRMFFFSLLKFFCPFSFDVHFTALVATLSILGEMESMIFLIGVPHLYSFLLLLPFLLMVFRCPIFPSFSFLTVCLLPPNYIPSLSLSLPCLLNLYPRLKGKLFPNSPNPPIHRTRTYYRNIKPDAGINRLLEHRVSCLPVP